MGQVFGNMKDSGDKPVQTDAQYNTQAGTNVGLSALSQFLLGQGQQQRPQGQPSPIVAPQQPQLPDEFWKSILGGR